MPSSIEQTKIKGCKRHLIVDVLDNVLWCYVTAANVADCKAAVVVVTAVLELYSRVAKVLADQAYWGDLAKQVKAAYDCDVEISQRPMAIEGQTETRDFIPEQFRWVVERSFAWRDNARALCRDYERLPENHEGMIDVVNIRLMLRRLAKNQRTWQAKEELEEA
ncbi:MAG: transposase [Hydrococcus sp. C42_A2020_068]|nr:transposase [Hydrococcus sp. C42_A2020_068]